MQTQENHVSMQIENVDECYLKSLEILAIATRDIDRPNREFWVFKRIEKAIDYYEKRVNDKG